ncbi:P-loop containing nucleoside triphosphate hydrolase protein [Xylariomycetidae sp. FL0641]|nr:P-loop containing nucleoside triphosphate hydrolase protein [Xylariomycetidae sp. FL0641]
MAPRWLLLADVHFQRSNLDSIIRTAQWITSLPQQHDIERVVICGDVLTGRALQSTDVLSATYRFLNQLSEAVPKVNVLLGNHDLPYKRDYATTALNALDSKRLSPFVSLHAEVGSFDWDGRRVLMLPFREDQSVLTAAVRALDPQEAADTVAFGHLALNKAVTTRHVVRPDGPKSLPVTYRGFLGPDQFLPLARTFTGHFHSHQTMLQSEHSYKPLYDPSRLQGSVTYIGAPLQLTWADLWDEQRGGLLLDPVTLEHELVVNPHAVQYVTADLTEVLSGAIDPAAIQGKQVMLLGELTRSKYLTARDTLLSHGARGVREWSPLAPVLQSQEVRWTNGFGATAPASDAELLKSEPIEPPPSDLKLGIQSEASGTSDQQPDYPSGAPTIQEVNPAQHLRNYVDALELDPSLDSQREALTQIGLHLIKASDTISADEMPEVSYKTLFDSSAFEAATQPTVEQLEPVNNFDARLRSVTIANFLGVQEAATIDFQKDLPPGLTFITGANGAGKSTLFEAIIWCQFGRCNRTGLAVGDVVNEVAGKNCCVSLSFANGYEITRFRQDQVYGNRVIVSLNGVEQPQYEMTTARETQAAIDELLGTDYDTFVRTSMLGHESNASFLSSSSVQRREIIESLLGLSTLDDYGRISRQMVREIDADADSLEKTRSGLEQTITHVQDRIADLQQNLDRFRKEVEDAKNALKKAETEEEQRIESTGSKQSSIDEEEIKRQQLREIDEAQKEVEKAAARSRSAELRDAVEERQNSTDARLKDAQASLDRLKATLHRLSDVKVASPPESQKRALGVSVNTLRNIRDRLAQIEVGRDIEDAPKTAPLATVVHIVQMSVAGLNIVISQLEGIGAQLPEEQEQEQEQQQGPAIQKLNEDIAQAETRIREIQTDRENITKHIADSHGVDQDVVSTALEEVGCEKTSSIRTHHNDAVKRFTEIVQQQARVRDLERVKERQGLAEEQERQKTNEEKASGKAQLLANSLSKQREVEAYTRFLEKEQASLDSLQQQHASLEKASETLASVRELYGFWENAFAVKRNTKASTASFRSYILEISLGDLNAVVRQLLAVLFQDTHHAANLSAGVLRSIFAEDEEQNGVLGRTLTIDPSLAYAKRSGGERKRIDLALFFGLLRLAQARSPHRARYLLVDEVFDSLDAAGRSLVARYADVLMAGVEHRLIITHSERLPLLEEVGSEEAGMKPGLLRVSMQKEGTRFEVNTF